MKTSQAFEVVRASAGSGKTYRLVTRYLACCLKTGPEGFKPEAFRHVLALTFTNKAAGEMKERILLFLKELGDSEASQPLVDEMTSQLGISEQELRTRARATRATMLHRYTEVAVMTLDSFTNRLVRSFARDLALDQDYRIELDQDRIIESAVDAMLDRIGDPQHKAFTQMLQGFARLQVEEEKDSRIRHPLLNHGKEVLKEGMRDVLEAMRDLTPDDFMRASKAIRADVAKAEKAVVAEAQAVLSAYEAEGLTPGDVSRKSLHTWIHKAANRTLEMPGKQLMGMFDDGVFTTQKAPQMVVDKVEVIRPLAEALLDSVAALMPGTPSGEEHQLKRALVHKLDLIGTLAVLSEEIEHVQATQNVRTFHALHDRVARVVKENPVPFLFERMGSRFHHVFIDEFQDTSVTQWQNLVPLYQHVLSVRNRTLVVGDGKQAIYRWRNGDYRQLLALPNMVDDKEGVFDEAAETFRQALHADSLEVNWRSGRAIVQWNNDFFDAVERRLPPTLANVYAGHKQHPKQAFEGEVHVQAVVEKDNEARKQRLHEAVVERIRHHVAAGFGWSDMAILVRTNKEGADLAQHLLDEGITPQTEDSLHLGRHPGALAVVALTRWILDPGEHRHATAWLQCMGALHPTTVEESTLLDQFVRLPQGGRSKDVTFDVLGLIREVAPDLDVVDRPHGPLVSWVGHACQAMGITGRFDAYAEGLMELALQVTGSDEGGLRGFVEAWDRRGHRQSIVASGGGNAVQVMTVHKAKGLAFPVAMVVAGTNLVRSVRGGVPVNLPSGVVDPIPAAILGVSDMEKTMLAPQAEAELDAALLDQINVLYVGMTRPVERLDVFAQMTSWKVKAPGPTQVGQWVVACATEASGVALDETRPSVTVGTPDRKSAKETPPSTVGLVQSPLVLGEESAQIVALPRDEGTRAGSMSDQQLGSFLHDVLSRVHYHGDWARERAQVEAMWSVDDADKARVVGWIDGMLNRPESAAFFTDSCQVETEVEWTDGEDVLRPDRVVFDGTTWHIVDFKTGAEDKEKDRLQVLGYMDVLASLESAPVKGWLLHLNPWRLVEIHREANPRIFEAD